MANVWSLHMYNLRQRLKNSDEIGVFVYDTCDDYNIAERQTVRLISHLSSVGNRVCRESKTYPPLIGKIFSNYCIYLDKFLKYIMKLNIFEIKIFKTILMSLKYRLI